MHKCCRNCIHYHGCLGEEESFYHIHDYCDKLDRTFMAPMNSVINNFLDDYCIEFDHLCDDHETGESYCYQFDQKDSQDESFNDNWMKENFEHNKKLAINLVDKIILEAKCYNNILCKEEELSVDDLKYFRALRKKIIDSTWEN